VYDDDDDDDDHDDPNETCQFRDEISSRNWQFYQPNSGLRGSKTRMDR